MPPAWGAVAAVLAAAAADIDFDGADDAIEPFFGLVVGDDDTDGDGIIDGDDAFGLDPEAGDTTAGFTPSCRRGRHLPDPEFHDASSQVTFELRNRLWVARTRADGRFEDPRVLDSDVVSSGVVRNGPEWVATDLGPLVLYTDRGGRVAIADPVTGTTGLVGNGLLPGFAPMGSLVEGDPEPWLYYLVEQPSGPPDAWIRQLYGTGPGRNLGPARLRFGAIRFAEDRVENGLPHTVVANRAVGTASELFELDLDDPDSSWRRVTDDGQPKYQAHGWRDPASGLDLIMTVHILDLDGDGKGDGPARVAIYEALTGELYQVMPTLPRMPFVVSPEPFVDRLGRSHVVMLVSTQPINFDNGFSRVFLGEVGRSGATPRPDLVFRRLDDTGGVPRRLRDPEATTFQGERDMVYFIDNVLGDLFVCQTGL